MSGTGFEIQIEDSRVRRAMEEMQRRAVKMRPFMRSVGMVMIKSTHDNFAAQGRPDRWKRRKDSTNRSLAYSAAAGAMRTKKHQNAKRDATKDKIEQQAMRRVRGNLILHRTGSLRQSIVLGQVTDRDVEIGSSLPYARIHQLGGKIKAVTIRARRKKALLIPTAGGAVLRKHARIPERTIPKRPYLLLQSKEIDTIARMAEDYLVRGEIG